MISSEKVIMATPLRTVVLISCGSFNPPTIMHMRLFELAKDSLTARGCHVLGGIMSPVHDAYGKKSLIPSHHRVAMVERSVQNYPFVKCSKWESQEASGWSRTLEVLRKHLQQIQQVQNDSSKATQFPHLPAVTSSSATATPQLMMICGGDLLESFSVPDLWKPEDMEAIVRDFGLVVITREGSDPTKYVDEHELLSKHKDNIVIVTENVPNDISSTRIRSAVKAGKSVRFFVEKPVIEYIESNKLYL